MADWTPISNALVAVGAKPFATTIAALRDNPVAIAENSSGAPIPRGVWHPYDQTAYGGGDGLIYSHAVSGTVASVTSPDLDVGYDYLWIWSGITRSATAFAQIQIRNRLVSTGAYTFTQDAGEISTGAALRYNSGWARLVTPSRVAPAHLLEIRSRSTTTPTNPAENADYAAATGGNFIATRNEPTKIDRTRMIPSSGSIGAGSIWLFKMRIEGL